MADCTGKPAEMLNTGTEVGATALLDNKRQSANFLLAAGVVQNRFDVDYGRAIDRLEVIDLQSTGIFDC